MRFFISYASANYAVAEEICNLIEKTGRQCFFAPRDIRTGYEYAEEIMNGIEGSDAMLLLLSRESNASPHVLREVERAVSKKIPIIVYKLEEVTLTKSMEYFLMSHQWISAKPGVGHAEVLKCIDEFDMDIPPEIEEFVERVSEFTRNDGLKPLFICLILLVVGIGIFFGVVSRKEEEKNVATEESIQNTQEVSPGNEQGNVQEDSVQVELGDTIVFGSYNEEAIEWRVLKLSEDGSSAVVVSKDILTMKAYDVAESGSYNYYNGKDYWGEDISGEEEEIQHQIRGNNHWAQSNIRTWLNSAAENVVYEDQAPIQIAMSEYKNGYDKEPGFLSNFSEEELEAILVTDVETNGEITQDKVFLLSTQELQWFKEADVSLPTKPTEAALEQDASNWYEVYVSGYNVEDYFWWLRDHAEDGEDAAPYKVYLVSFSYTDNKVISEGVDSEGFGVRPAMTINLSAECIEVK